MILPRNIELKGLVYDYARIIEHPVHLNPLTCRISWVVGGLQLVVAPQVRRELLQGGHLLRAQRALEVTRSRLVVRRLKKNRCAIIYKALNELLSSIYLE